MNMIRVAPRKPGSVMRQNTGIDSVMVSLPFVPLESDDIVTVILGSGTVGTLVMRVPVVIKPDPADNVPPEVIPRPFGNSPGSVRIADPMAVAAAKVKV